jgi:hypothetical protein
MAKSAVVRVIAETQQYDRSIDNAAKKLQQFGKDGIGSLTGLAGSWTKLVPAIGAAVGAHNLFNKALQSSQTLDEAFARAQAAAKTSVDNFFVALTSGDWSAFNDGLDAVIAKAATAASAIDQLGNSVMSLGVVNAKAGSDFQKAMTVLRGAEKGTEEYQQALEDAKKAVQEMSSATSVVQTDQWRAMATQIASWTSLNEQEIKFDWVLNAETLDSSENRDAIKEQARKNTKTYQDEVSKLNREFYTTSTVGFGEGTSTVQTLKAGKELSEYEQRMKALNETYGESIVITTLLDRKNDETLQGLDQLMVAYYGNERAVDSYMTQIARLEKGTDADDLLKKVRGGTTKAAKEVEMSLADVRTELERIKATDGPVIDADGQSIDRLQTLIKAAQKAAGEATSASAQAEAQSVANELQRILDNRTFEVKMHVSAIEGEITNMVTSTSSGTSGIQSVHESSGLAQAAANMDNSGLDETADKYNKAQKAAKDFTDFQKQMVTTGVNELTDAFSTLGYAIGGVEGSIISLIAQMAQEVIQGAATIASLTAQSAKYKEEAGDAALAAGAKAMDAHSWIPFVGIAMGVGAVATIIATLSNMPKFAEGGLVSKPTVGLFGEAGPEAVIPLDRLEKMMENRYGQQGESWNGRVEFHIRDTELVGILQKHESRAARR